MITEALLPSAVSAKTSGAILSVVMRDTGPPPCLAAFGAAIAPRAVTMAAIRNSEQKIRRRMDCANVDACLEFVVIELPIRLFCIRNQSLAPKLGEGG